MTDELDVAAEETEKANQEAVKRTLRAMEEECEEFDGIHCVGCGDEIPEERRRILPKACRCVLCQEEKERLTKLHR